MKRRDIESHPQVYARTSGAIYLAVIVLGAFAEGFVTNQLVVSHDAAASANNILRSPELWRLGVASDLLIPVLAIPQLWIEYLLLRPVSKNLALLAAMFNLVSLAVESISKLCLLVILPTLESTEYLKAFDLPQLQALANLALLSHDVAFNIALIFFGCTCILYGYLIYQSAYLPKAIGILMAIAGLSYLTACLSALVAPAFADSITPGILLPALVGESSFCLWLLTRGVNVAKWNERISLQSRSQPAGSL